MGERVFVIVLALLVFMSFQVSAANIGVSPANIDFKDVLRGGYAERPIIVTIDSIEPIKAAITSRGDISEWISLSKDNFETSKGSPSQLMISVSPPIDTPNGIYSGFATIQIEKLGEGGLGFATGLVIPALDVYITVQVTDQEFISCKATSFEVTTIEEGSDMIFSLDILNSGNIRLSPEVTFDIWDQESINLIREEKFSDVEIVPTKKESLLIKIPSEGLDIGQYWVDVSVPDCYISQTLTFDILEIGALRSFGTLEQIIVVPWADIDEIIGIVANFKNTGEKPLDARFEGKITYNNKIIQLIKSEEPLFVPMDEQSNFQFYFTPKKSGKYVISGRVFYDNKRTYEQASILNVRPGIITVSSIIRNISYVVLLIVIATLIFKIHNERKRYSSKVKRFRK